MAKQRITADMSGNSKTMPGTELQYHGIEGPTLELELAQPSIREGGVYLSF
jgi:hypothetical protein